MTTPTRFALGLGIALSLAALSQVLVVRGQSGPRLYTTWSQPGGSIEGAQYTKSQISVPGELGGANWGGAAADPETGMLYVRSADQPALHTPLTLAEPSAAIDRMTPQPRYTASLRCTS